VATVSRRSLGRPGDRRPDPPARRRSGPAIPAMCPIIAARPNSSRALKLCRFVMPVRGPDFLDSYLGEFLTGLGEGLVDHGFDLLSPPCKRPQRA